MTYTPQLEQLEDRCLMSGVTGFSSVTEVGNNVADPTQGTANTDLIRVSPAAFSDGLSKPSQAGFPSPRLISNDVFNQATTLFGPTDVNIINSDKGLSDFAYTFGQFIDHDLSLTPDSSGQPTNPTTKDGNNGFPIPADKTHPTDPIGSLAFSRVQFDPATGTTNPRQEINVNTSYLDLSQVYGSTQAVSDALRTGVGGLLKSNPGADGIVGTADDLLPYDNSTYFTADQIAALNMANDVGAVTTDKLFAAGDVRANETIELTALQTLFMRNHNRIAATIAQQDPSKFGVTAWTDQTLFDEARKLNIAQYQSVIYNQYLPTILGTRTFPPFRYTGYDPTVDVSVATEFSTVAFRGFGHTLLNNTVNRDNNSGASVGAVPLAQTFFDPNLVGTGVDPLTGLPATGIDAILRGDADHNAQAIDSQAVSSIRNLLFGNGPPGSPTGEDLIARDIWRAHDDGIGTYNQLRVAYRLAPITDDATHGFDQITSDPAVQAKLETAYASIIAAGKFAGDIDPFVAGLAEDHLPGAGFGAGASSMGALFTAIVHDQFTRLATGDRFFFLNESMTSAEDVMVTTGGNILANVIRNNTSVTNLQSNVFRFAGGIIGTVRDAQGHLAAGVTVTLTDPSGATFTVVTNAVGRYFYGQNNLPPTFAAGISGTGVYQVTVAGVTKTATVTNSDDVETVNFGTPRQVQARGGFALPRLFGLFSGLFVR